MFEIISKSGNNYKVLDTERDVVGLCSISDIISHCESGFQIKGVALQDDCYVFEIDNLKCHRIMKGYKFRLYPNKEQQEYFQKCFGCCRFIWNHMLADKIEYYNKYQESLDTQPADYKTEFTFLKEADSHALASEYMHLNTAFKNFFRDKSVGYPKFKKKHDNHKSFTTYNQKGSVKIIDKYVKLPKIGYVKLKQSQPILGTIKNTTVSQVPSGKYYISFNVEIWQQELPKTSKEVGVDLGIKDLIILSDGTKFENPKILYKYEKQLAKLQRQLSHKKLHSNNWKKQKHRIAILHERVANIRKDNIHKITHQMIMENQLIVTEDLSIKNMMQNHHLAKSISDVSWYEITRQLAYKSDWFGQTYIKINKFYASSQICSNCGYKNSNVKNLAVREWTCPKCGAYHDRDINASNNILTEGKRLTALAI
jgi:putative transposase